MFIKNEDQEYPYQFDYVCESFERRMEISRWLVGHLTNDENFVYKHLDYCKIGFECQRRAIEFKLRFS